MISVLPWACFTLLPMRAPGDPAPVVPQEAAVEALDVRVMVSSPGSLVVDRGSVDFVQVGDAASFTLKDGTTKRGTVAKADERSATVKLDDKAAVVPAGA